MDMQSIFFFLFAGLAIACALMVVFKENPVSSALSLVMVFFAFAGIYALQEAHLIASLQILVYAGAIMVLFIFVIMLLNADVPSLDLGRASMGLRFGAVGLCGTLLGIFSWAFRVSQGAAVKGAFTAEAIESAGGNTRVISELMFSQYILPFELTSVLLLGAIVGTVAIAKRKLNDRRGP